MLISKILIAQGYTFLHEISELSEIVERILCKGPAHWPPLLFAPRIDAWEHAVENGSDMCNSESDGFVDFAGFNWQIEAVLNFNEIHILAELGKIV